MTNTNTLTPEQLGELERLLAIVRKKPLEISAGLGPELARLIVAAVNALPALIAAAKERDRLRRELQDLRDARREPELVASAARTLRAENKRLREETWTLGTARDEARLECRQLHQRMERLERALEQIRDADGGLHGAMARQALESDDG